MTDRTRSLGWFASWWKWFPASDPVGQGFSCANGIWIIFTMLAFSALGGLHALGQFSEVEPILDGEWAEVPSVVIPDGTVWEVRHFYAWDLHAGRLRELRARAGVVDTPTGENGPARGAELAREEFHFHEGVLKARRQYKDGATDWRYHLGGMVVHADGDGELLAEPAVEFFGGQGFNPRIFNEFNWIEDAEYVGRAEYGSRVCHVYRLSRTGPLGENRILRTAFFDVETGLPVGLEDHRGIRLYSFEPGYTELNIPAEIHEAVQVRDQIVEDRERKYQIPE